jgi:hypothetical protein
VRSFLTLKILLLLCSKLTLHVKRSLITALRLQRFITLVVSSLRHFRSSLTAFLTSQGSDLFVKRWKDVVSLILWSLTHLLSTKKVLVIKEHLDLDSFCSRISSKLKRKLISYLKEKKIVFLNVVKSRLVVLAALISCQQFFFRLK